MNKFLASAGAIATLALISSPAAAVSPSTQATANAKVYKPLTISAVQNLDFGVVVLAGSGFTGETVSMDTSGTVTCGTTSGDLTCSGSPQVAKYHLVGSNNANVTITSPGFNLSNGSATLPFAPAFPGTVNLGSTGAVDFSIGGTISNLANTTSDGVYTGTFNVTADYQ